MVKDTEDKLLELAIVKKEFSALEAALDCAPSIEKLPAPLLVSAFTKPSVSVVITEAPLSVNAVFAVPVWEAPILLASVVPTNFKKLSKFEPIEFIAIDVAEPMDPELIE